MRLDGRFAHREVGRDLRVRAAARQQEQDLALALGLITCVVFFIGLPIVLGMAAVCSDLRANRRAPAALGVVGCSIG
jgi:hypothetical protein